MNRLILYSLILLSMVRAEAAVEVAFYEIVGPDGKVIELEPGGRFAHAAIRVGDRWLQAHPYYGVIYSDDVTKIGRLAAIVVQEDLPEISEEEVSGYLGLPYDPYFSWEDKKSTYCSKLVGQILAVEPLPMVFTTDYWKTRKIKAKPGDVGVSPDGLYRALIKRGYHEI